MNAPVGMLVDHKDRNGLNNTRDNLRLATRGQNRRNSKTPAWLTKTSKYKGVRSSGGKANRYRSQIRVNGRLVHLGMFETEKDAAMAYDVAAQEHFGEFAGLNFPAAMAM